MEDKKLLDDYSRNLNYLRVSITDRCNLRCMYCEPRRLSPKLSHADVLSYEEIPEDKQIKVIASVGNPAPVDQQVTT